MQLPIPDPSTVAPYFGWIIAIILLIEKVATFISNRRESRARIHKTEAEADEIQIRANISLGEKSAAWTRQMIKAQEIIVSQDTQIRRLEHQNKSLTEENDLLRSDTRKQIGGAK